jgi:hypothetical protein
VDHFQHQAGKMLKPLWTMILVCCIVIMVGLYIGVSATEACKLMTYLPQFGFQHGS